MASQVDIANRALTKLGDVRITSLTDNTNQARVINSMWESVRDAELRAYIWRFAISRASLAALTETPAFGYAFQYQLPSDCLRLIEVTEYRVNGLNDYITTNDALFSVEGSKILTNLGAPLNIRYLRREEDTQQYNVDFVEALACRLAAECAETLTNSSTKRELAWQEYKEAIKLAKRTNALETPSRSIMDNSWIISRL